MDEDEALERIKRKKLREMFKSKALKEASEGSREKRVSALSKPVEMSDATFPTVIQNHPLVVVDCWASWCGPCRMVAPIIEDLARDYAGKILFGKLNVDENRRVPMQYQIMSIPTLLVFKDGKLVDRIIGAMPRPMLEQKIIPYL
jgi:thioredoxin 1